MLKVAINGFGRIGREIFRINLEKKFFEVVAINDLTSPHTLAHLLKYDSNFGTLTNEVNYDENNIVVDGKNHRIYCERDPEKLPWKELDVDVVIEATGVFRHREGAQKHLTAGAKRVIVSAPGKDLDFTVVLGVNHQDYKAETHKLISNASCTTNCLAPLAKVLHDSLKIEKGLMTTIHSYTNDQKILDLPHKDLRRARAGGLSIIPTTTGAAKAVTEVIPDLKGKLNGMAVRVPTPTVSLVDLTVQVGRDTSIEEVNEILKNAAVGPMQGILGYSTQPLVSVDYKGNPLSSIVDSLSTEVIGGNMVKVISWYDNEWGYSARVVDLVKMIEG
jgi:glyceraldehyde 3-phosphate dehydrogenase